MSFGLLLSSGRSAQVADQRVGTRRAEACPPPRVLRPATASSAVDGMRGNADALARRRERTAAPASRATAAGDHAGARRGRARRAAARRCASGRVYDAARGESARASASRYGGGSARLGLGTPLTTRPTACGGSRRGTVDGLRAASSTPRSARRSPAWSAATRRRGRRSSLDATRALYCSRSSRCRSRVINLFPFLPLDGGHIFWARGREGARARDPLRAHGARERRRVRARARRSSSSALTNDIGRFTARAFGVADSGAL